MSTLRQDTILRAVRRSGSVRAAEMAAELGVPAMTVRRDINALARRGAVTRVHGGATLPRPTERTPAPAPAAPRGSRPTALGWSYPP
ncbi:DeoR family transcriptional regulator [Streptomyces sp. NPDC002004]